MSVGGGGGGGAAGGRGWRRTKVLVGAILVGLLAVALSSPSSLPATISSLSSFTSSLYSATSLASFALTASSLSSPITSLTAATSYLASFRNLSTLQHSLVSLYSSLSSLASPLPPPSPHRRPHPPVSHSHPFVPSFPFTTWPVKILLLPDEVDPSWTSRVVKEDVPVVIRNSVASRWPALHKWSVEYLSEVIGRNYTILEDQSKIVRGGNGHVKYHRFLGDMAPWPHLVPNHEASSRTFGEFADSVLQNSTETRVYHYAAIRFDSLDISFEKSVLGGDLLGVNEFGVSDSLEGDHLGVPTQFLWIGSTGIGSVIHYDAHTNFHSCVVGRKRFLLLPPSAIFKLPGFPRSHPGWRGLDMEFEKENMSEEMIEVMEGLGATEVLLYPGETLYIPPMWFHHVTNFGEEDGSPGITFNYWTPNKFDEKMTGVRRSYFVAPASMSIPTRVAGTYAYLVDILQRVGKDPQEYLQIVFEMRYQHLMEVEQSSVSEEVRASCRKIKKDGVSSLLKEKSHTHVKGLVTKSLTQLEQFEEKHIFEIVLLELVEVTMAKGLIEFYSEGDFLESCFGG